MSYIVPDGSPSPRRPRRWLWVGGAIVAVIALVVLAFAVGRSGAQRDTTATPPAPSEGLRPGPDITWASVGSQLVPVSAAHGPREQNNGLATGFTHDEIGAAMAAINLTARTSKAAGSAVYVPTVLQQCIGDQDSTIAGLNSQEPYEASGGKPTVEELFYLVVSGDPDGNIVVVAAAALTPESRNLGGYAQYTRTLHWIDGDWKMQVPPSKPHLVTKVDGYTPLGKPRG